ncbi:hypothetical protein BDZ91DRAFT_537289 [Kalaharituber pfeilii]|nr:hypothetical protein BDZ91DRAFT_537289 [Kalaharituber pfeilii]
MPKDKKTEEKDSWDFFVKDLLKKNEKGKQLESQRTPLTQANLQKATATPTKPAPKQDPFTIAARAVAAYLKTQDIKAEKGSFMYFEFLDDPDDPVGVYGDPNEGRPRWVEYKKKFVWPDDKSYRPPALAPPPPPPKPQVLGFSPISCMHTPPSQPRLQQAVGFSPIVCIETPPQDTPTPTPPTPQPTPTPNTPTDHTVTRKKRKGKQPSPTTPYQIKRQLSKKEATKIASSPVIRESVPPAPAPTTTSELVTPHGSIPAALTTPAINPTTVPAPAPARLRQRSHRPTPASSYTE